MKKRIVLGSIFVIIVCLLIGFFVQSKYLKSDESETEICFVGGTSAALNDFYREKPAVLVLTVVYGNCLYAARWGTEEEKNYSEKIKMLMLYGLLKDKKICEVLALKDRLSQDDEKIRIRNQLNWDPSEELFLSTLLHDPLWKQVNAAEVSKEQQQRAQDNIKVFLETFTAPTCWSGNPMEIVHDIYSDDDYAGIVCNVVDFINTSTMEGGDSAKESLDMALPYAAALYFKKNLSIGNNTCTNHQFEAIMHRRMLSMDREELKTVLKRGRYDIFFHESKKGIIPASLDELTELWYHQIHTKQTILP